MTSEVCKGGIHYQDGLQVGGEALDLFELGAVADNNQWYPTISFRPGF